MKPIFDINDWQIGVDPNRENAIAQEFQRIFIAFLEDCHIDAKSSTTRNRYICSLNALAGYLIEKAVNCENSDPEFSMDSEALLMDNIDAYEGPLVFMENEAWQNELDMVCRKLFKFMQKSK